MATINQTINMGRFGCLLRKYFIENWRRLSMQFLGMTAIMILVLLFLEHQQYAPPSSEIFVMLGIIVYIYGMVIASDAFRSLGRPTTALSTLMCPASQFEGFLLRWIIAVPLFLLWALASAFIADWVRVIYGSFIGHTGEFADWGMLLVSREENFGPTDDESLLFSFLGNFLVMQSFFLLGSIVWSRNALIKTVVAMFVIWMSYVFAVLAFVNVFADGSLHYKGSQNGDTFGWVMSAVQWCVILFNYLLAYMRYREAEIINRW